MSRCGFCLNLGFDVASKSHTVRECWRLASTQCLSCGEFGHTVSRCHNSCGDEKQYVKPKHKQLITGTVNVKFVRKDTPRPSYNPKQLINNHKSQFAILAGLQEVDGVDGVDEGKVKDVKSLKVDEVAKVDVSGEIPLAKPKPLIGAWGNGLPVIEKKQVEKVVQPVRIAIPSAASKLSVTLSVIGSTGLTTNSSKDVNVTDIGWADDDGEFDEDPATMFD